MLGDVTTALLQHATDFWSGLDSKDPEEKDCDCDGRTWQRMDATENKGKIEHP